MADRKLIKLIDGKELTGTIESYKSTEDGLKINFKVDTQSNLKGQTIEIKESEVFMIVSVSEEEQF